MSLLHELQGDSPWKEQHDLTTTRDTISQMLKDGTPDWFTHPEDYKNFAIEALQAEREQSNAQAAQYRMANQDLLSHRASRMVNPMATRLFIEKLRAYGVKCFTLQVAPGNQTGLWAVPKGHSKPVYVAYCQIPAMYEWSVLRIDEHGLGSGEDYRGWRTVLCQLILRDILTEQEAHTIFGEPSGEASAVYRQTLWNFRNGRGRKAVVTAPEL